MSPEKSVKRKRKARLVWPRPTEGYRVGEAVTYGTRDLPFVIIVVIGSYPMSGRPESSRANGRLGGRPKGSIVLRGAMTREEIKAIAAASDSPVTVMYENMAFW